ncbi:MAG: imidazoleglycerol-phosphate dehydratase HisB [Clostridia bacterium]|nr:imidazoleglycerol-phosphate dehydratase HisB [Clostridia bacterium]
MRSAEITRKTSETEIELRFSPDGGNVFIDSGVGFLNHMLTLFAAHGRFGFELRCKSDTDVDDHHSVEDIGIALGEAFAKALGEKRGIKRYGSCILPMDETLILTAVDFSGRAHLTFDAPMPAQKVGTFDTELVREFWLGFVRNAACTLHIRKISGENTHHIIEGIFKSAARSIKAAVAIDGADPNGIPSTKGVL